MIKKNVHMQDQIPNRIEILMQDNRLAMLRYWEEISIAVLLVSVFVLGAKI